MIINYKLLIKCEKFKEGNDIVVAEIFKGGSMKNCPLINQYLYEPSFTYISFLNVPIKMLAMVLDYFLENF